MAKSNIKQMPVQAQKPVPMTEEEIKRKQTEFLMQKRESFAQGILYNLCQNVRIVDYDETDKIVDKSIKMADRLIEVLYGVSFVKKEKPETKED